jgi:hypothetical protein
MVGGPSQIDTFDPKPALKKFEGQKLPESFGQVKSQFTDGTQPILPSPWEFKRYGQSGLPVSSLYPHLAQCVDDICFVRSFYTESVVHAPAMYQVHTGRILMGYPSMGSWVTYGLGTESENLAGLRRDAAARRDARGRHAVLGRWISAGRVPGQSVAKRSRSDPESEAAGGMTPQRQRATLDLLQKMNELDTPPDDSEMAARISSYELAFRMQSHAPEAVDLAKESEATKRMYGLDDKRTSEFGTRCLLARRMVERGVRFVQIYSGGGPISMQWDAHKDLVENHEKMCGITDQPIAALLKDLKQRGLLDSTLVSGAASSDVCPCRRAATGAITTRTGSRCGSRAAA